METPYSTPINNWPQFPNIQNIKRTELSKTCRRFIKEKEQYLEKNCRRIWLAKNNNEEVFIFGGFCKKSDRTIVTIACYIPYVGFVTSH